MKTRTYEGIFVALLPQRGDALLELLRDCAGRFLEGKDKDAWSIEYGALTSPAGGVAFRLAHATDVFPWRDGGYMELARAVSKHGQGRVWAVGLEKVAKLGEPEGWAEGIIFDRGEQTLFEEATGPSARTDLVAWFAQELALSENEVMAVFESCDQSAGVVAGEEKFEDEVDQALARARREFLRYQQLKEERERGK